MDKPPTVKIWDTWSQMSFFVDNAAHTSSPPDAGATRYPVCDCAERELMEAGNCYFYWTWIPHFQSLLGGFISTTSCREARAEFVGLSIM